MSFSSNTKTVTRSIRIKEESEKIIEEEADRVGTTVNSLVSTLVDQYVDSLRFFKSAEMISMRSDIIMGLLDSFSDDEIAIFSYQKGSLWVKDDLMQRGMKVNYDNLLWYINQILGQSNRWFRYDFHEEGNTDFLHLSHNYGRKWSVFISNFLAGIIFEVIGVKINTGVSINAVNFEIRKTA